jgi:hypothetical protein
MAGYDRSQRRHLAMRTRQFAQCFTVVAIALVFAASGWAEITNCTPITSLPATISTQGIYCLTGNLATGITTGSAISISANNVTLDMNGWKLGGQSAGSGTAAFGVYSSAINVTVRNGIVRGFHTGILLTGRGARVEDLLVDQNTTIGIYVAGQGSVVRRNQIIDTGGSTSGSDVQVDAVYLQGTGSVFEDNIISGLTATGNGDELAVHITDSADQTVVRGNVVSDDARSAGTGSTFGILVGDADDVIMVENDVINFDYGIIYAGSATGTYAQNVVVNCSTKYSGGTPGSDND